MFARVTFKIDNMRKPQEFVVLHMSDGRIMAQSDKRMAQFDPSTGEGKLSTRGNTTLHLHPHLGGKDFTFPPDFVQSCVDALPTPGGSTDMGGIIVEHTVKVI